MQNENRDALTGLANWKYVSSILPGILGHNGQVALILIDVDRLKPFHDAYGHPPADALIAEVGREMQTLCGGNALVFRLGGDEFGVILYEASLKIAREIAENIRSQRERMMITPDQKRVPALTLSLGIAHFPTHVSNAENLIRAADLALMKAKGQGKEGGRWLDGTPYTPRNRVIAIGDFLDDFPEQSAEFLK